MVLEVSFKPEANFRHPTMKPCQSNNYSDKGPRHTTRDRVWKISPQIHLLKVSQVTRLAISKEVTFKAELGLRSG